MHQNGQNSALLRLDPPGLGTLSIHVALGRDAAGAAQVNLLFVPSAAPTAQLLTSNMDGLRQAMAGAGLTLGQTQVGGGGQGNNSGQQNNHPPANSGAAPPADATRADTARAGARAYA
jgi:flagellar hook-length control protein FliK